jgi:homogentisate 1,2-dioxygenase
MSLPNRYFPHDPDHDAWARATTSELAPERLEGTLGFMFASRYALIPTACASSIPALQEDYPTVWHGLERHLEG